MFEFINQNQDVVWPSVPNPWASAIGCLLYQFEHTQWLSPTEIKSRQWEQILRLLHFTVNHSSFYKSLYKEYGIDINGIENLCHFQKLPLVNRNQLQQYQEDWFVTAPPKDHGALLEHMTSGSSGRPLLSKSTNLTHLIKSALILRQHQWAGRDLSKKVIFITEGGSSGKISHSSNWESATKYAIKTGKATSLPLSMSVAELLYELRKSKAEYLIAYPSIVESMLLECQYKGTSMPKLEQIGTFGEAVPDRLRQLAEDEFGIQLFDNYSAAEIGPIASQCPEAKHYHIQSESVYVEVLNHDDSPTKPGDIGRVVVTALHNFAAPLIRYEVGDLAQVGEDCQCGRGLPVIKKIIGRQRSLFVYPNGNKKWPVINHDDFALFCRQNHLLIFQFQLEQKKIDSLTLRLVTDRVLTAKDKEYLIEFIQNQLGYSFNIEVEQHEQIGRSKSGKYQDFISSVDG